MQVSAPWGEFARNAHFGERPRNIAAEAQNARQRPMRIRIIRLELDRSPRFFFRSSQIFFRSQRARQIGMRLSKIRFQLSGRFQLRDRRIVFPLMPAAPSPASCAHREILAPTLRTSRIPLERVAGRPFAKPLPLRCRPLAQTPVLRACSAPRRERPERFPRMPTQEITIAAARRRWLAFGESRCRKEIR